MSDERLVVNVEEQIAKRLHDAGFPHEAKLAVIRSQSLPDDTSLDSLEAARWVPLTDKEKAQRARDGEKSAWENLRADRDGLLAASDWTQLPDVPAAKREAWAKYRQKLRDLPAKTKDPTKAAWPEPPA